MKPTQVAKKVTVEIDTLLIPNIEKIFIVYQNKKNKWNTFKRITKYSIFFEYEQFGIRMKHIYSTYSANTAQLFFNKLKEAQDILEQDACYELLILV